jgi:hypothetical protein
MAQTTASGRCRSGRQIREDEQNFTDGGPTESWSLSRGPAWADSPAVPQPLPLLNTHMPVAPKPKQLSPWTHPCSGMTRSQRAGIARSERTCASKHSVPELRSRAQLENHLQVADPVGGDHRREAGTAIIGRDPSSRSSSIGGQTGRRRARRRHSPGLVGGVRCGTLSNSCWWSLAMMEVVLI